MNKNNFRIMIVIPLSSIAAAATLAPRIEIFTALICRVHRSELFYPLAGTFSPSFSSTRDRCASDPVVQAAVAKLMTGKWCFHYENHDLILRLTSYVREHGHSRLLNGRVVGFGACRLNHKTLRCSSSYQYSDRHGRIWVLRISIMGLLATDLNFIAAVSFQKFSSLPGSYWLLMLGPVVEGCLGGEAMVNHEEKLLLTICSYARNWHYYGGLSGLLSRYNGFWDAVRVCNIRCRSFL